MGLATCREEDRGDSGEPKESPVPMGFATGRRTMTDGVRSGGTITTPHVGGRKKRVWGVTFNFGVSLPVAESRALKLMSLKRKLESEGAASWTEETEAQARRIASGEEDSESKPTIGNTMPTPEQWDRVTSNIALAQFMAKRVGSGRDRLWRIDACMDGLIRASVSYDANRGLKFSTYAAICMDRAMADAHHARKRDRATSLSLVGDVPGGQDAVGFGPLGLTQSEVRDAILRVKQVMSQNEYVSLALSVGGETYKRIGERLGVSHERVRQYINAGIEKCRRSERLAYLLQSIGNDERQIQPSSAH